jgi:hypothetical protein
MIKTFGLKNITIQIEILLSQFDLKKFNTFTCLFKTLLKHETSKLDEEVMLLISVQDVPVLNLSWDSNYLDCFHGFPQSLQADAIIVP